MESTINPVAAAAMAAVQPHERRMSAHELNNMLVGPGGKPVRQITILERLYAALGWCLIRATILFCLLTAGAYVTLKWPTAPWVQAATRLQQP